MAMTKSMGPIVDRREEHLGTTDQMVIQTRRRWLTAIRDLLEGGTVPPGVDNPELYHQKGGQVVLPRDVDWWVATKELREFFNGQTVE